MKTQRDVYPGDGVHAIDGWHISDRDRREAIKNSYAEGSLAIAVAVTQEATDCFTQPPALTILTVTGLHESPWWLRFERVVGVQSLIDRGKI